VYYNKPLRALFNTHRSYDRNTKDSTIVTPPKNGLIALWTSTNGAIPYFLVLPGSENTKGSTIVTSLALLFRTDRSEHFGIEGSVHGIQSFFDGNTADSSKWHWSCFVFPKVSIHA